jgi:hypothetical protein
MDFVTQNMQTIVTIAAALAALFVLTVVWRLVSPRLLGRHGNRLAVVEFREVDRSRRLVLVRRDQTEHLLLIGGHNDVVIESGFAAASAASSPAPGSSRPAPRPAVFGERKAPPLRSADQAAARDEPAV